MYDAFDKRWLSSFVTVTLVLLNAVLFLFSSFDNGALYSAGVLDVSLVTLNGEYNRLVTAMFLHADIIHLFSNMVLLFYVGGVVERNLGCISYMFLYFACGIAGNILTVVYELSNRQNWTSIGASGAVFGIMGAMAVLVIKARHTLRAGSTLLRRIVFMVVYSLYAGMRSSTVNNIAHAGGLISGICITFLLTMSRNDINVDALY